MPGDGQYSGTLSGAQVQEVFSAFGGTAVFTVPFLAVLISALEVEGRDVLVLLTSSQGTGSGLDSRQGHLFLKKLETSGRSLCLFRRSEK